MNLIVFVVLIVSVFVCSIHKSHSIDCVYDVCTFVHTTTHWRIRITTNITWCISEWISWRNVMSQCWHLIEGELPTKTGPPVEWRFFFLSIHSKSIEFRTFVLFFCCHAIDKECSVFAPVSTNTVGFILSKLPLINKRWEDDWKFVYYKVHRVSSLHTFYC